MAWISIEFNSIALKMPVEVEMLVPQPDYGQNVHHKGLKVMILLHDINGDRTEWLLRSQISEMVKEQPVVVVMPSGKNSFFVNTVNGYRYMDFITKEIPDFIKKYFRVSENKKDWLVAGAGMGGYGAAVCGFHAGKQFGNVGIFSGNLDIMDKKMHSPMVNMELVFGSDGIADSSYNIYKYCHEVPEKERPEIFLCCGIRDVRCDMNRRFYDEIKNEYNVSYLEGDGGADFWYWNQCLKEMLCWFVENNSEGEVGV